MKWIPISSFIYLWISQSQEEIQIVSKSSHERFWWSPFYICVTNHTDCHFSEMRETKCVFWQAQHKSFTLSTTLAFTEWRQLVKIIPSLSLYFSACQTPSSWYKTCKHESTTCVINYNSPTGLCWSPLILDK